MGLPSSFLRLLTSTVLLHRAATTTDEWGNEIASSPEEVECVVGEVRSEYATGEVGGTVQSNPNETVTIYTDAIGIRLSDKVELPTLTGSNPGHDGVLRKVTAVVTYRDRKGYPLYQEVTITTE